MGYPGISRLVAVKGTVNNYEQRKLILDTPQNVVGPGVGRLARKNPHHTLWTTLTWPFYRLQILLILEEFEAFLDLSDHSTPKNGLETL